MGEESRTTPAVMGRCPKCNSEVIDVGRLYKCTENRDELRGGRWVPIGSCDFLMWKQVAHHDLSREDVEGLLAGEPVHMSGLRRADGSEFEADVYLDPEHDYKATFAR